MPGSNPSGSGNSGFDENLFNSGNSGQAISDPAFWDDLAAPGESDKEEDSTPTEAPKPSPPTGKLTQQAIKDNDATTKQISPTEFNDWEGESRQIKSRELKKTVFAKGYDAGVVPADHEHHAKGRGGPPGAARAVRAAASGDIYESREGNDDARARIRGKTGVRDASATDAAPEAKNEARSGRAAATR